MLTRADRSLSSSEVETGVFAICPRWLINSAPCPKGSKSSPSSLYPNSEGSRRTSGLGNLFFRRWQHSTIMELELVGITPLRSYVPLTGDLCLQFLNFIADKIKGEKTEVFKTGHYPFLMHIPLPLPRMAI